MRRIPEKFLTRHYLTPLAALIGIFVYSGWYLLDQRHLANAKPYYKVGVLGASLMSEPDLNSQKFANLRSSLVLVGTGQKLDSEWIEVTYGDETGWVLDPYVECVYACHNDK